MSIIHRDVKPENIVFENKGSLEMPVLVDLGFATFERDYRSLFVRCGTPGYVAPEVLLDKDYTCKVDVFSLGVSECDIEVILFMMITRSNPFDNASYDMIIHNNQTGTVDFSKMRQNKNISSESRCVVIIVIDIIENMLIIDQHERPHASQLLRLFKEKLASNSG